MSYENADAWKDVLIMKAFAISKAIQFKPFILTYESTHYQKAFNYGIK